MTNRYNVIVARPGKDDKTFWHRIGTAWPRDGGGMSVTLDSLPIPGKDGKVGFLIVDADKDGKPTQSGVKHTQSGVRKPAADDLQDDVPF